MGIPLQCPGCQQPCVLDPFLAGRRVRCPCCKEEFTAPSPTAERAPQGENDSPLPPPLPSAIQSESAPATGVPRPTLGCDVSIPQLSRPPRRSRAIVLLSVAAGAVAMLLLGIVLDRFVLPHDSTGDENAEKARNLLVNGNFEEGPEIATGWFITLENGSAALPGWVVSQGNINVVDSLFYNAAGGKRSLDLNGTMPGAIRQTFKSKKGQKYRLTFALAGNATAGPTMKTLQVSAGGKTKEFTFDTAGKTRNNMGWVSKTWEFTAESDQTTLEFLSLTPGDSGSALDDVVVVAIRD